MLGKPEIIGKSGQAYQKTGFLFDIRSSSRARESCYRDGSQEAVYQALAAEVFSQWLVDPNYSVAGWGFRWPLKTSWDIHSVNHIIILVTWGIWSFQNLLKDLWLKTLLQTSGSRCRIGPKSRWRCADPGGSWTKVCLCKTLDLLKSWRSTVVHPRDPWNHPTSSVCWRAEGSNI